MRNLKLCVHPDNVEAVRSGLRKISARVGENVHVDFNPKYLPFEIVASEFVPKEEFTGKYRLPSGAKVQPKDVCIVERFVTYGPEDLKYLLYSGMIVPDVEIVAYILDVPDIGEIIKNSIRISCDSQRRLMVSSQLGVGFCKSFYSGGFD